MLINVNEIYNSTLETAQVTEDLKTELDLEKELEIQAENEKDAKNRALLLALERSQVSIWSTFYVCIFLCESAFFAKT